MTRKETGIRIEIVIEIEIKNVIETKSEIAIGIEKKNDPGIVKRNLERRHQHQIINTFVARRCSRPSLSTLPYPLRINPKKQKRTMV